MRVIVTGIKGSRAAARIARPLVLHENDGSFRPEAAALHRGAALVSADGGRPGNSWF